jgi:hypothetical protein
VTICLKSWERPPGAVSGPYPTAEACVTACYPPGTGTGTGTFGSYWYCMRPPVGTGTGTGTGTGPGGSGIGVVVGCCPQAIRRTLYATLGGVLGGIGTVAIVYNDVAQRWEDLHVEGCGGTFGVWLICRDDGSFIFNVTGTTVIGVTAEAPAESCSPFLWSSTGVVNGLSCDGAFEVTVDEGP